MMMAPVANHTAKIDTAEKEKNELEAKLEANMKKARTTDEELSRTNDFTANNLNNELEQQNSSRDQVQPTLAQAVANQADEQEPAVAMIIESSCHRCKDPAIREHNVSKGYLSNEDTGISVKPCLLRLHSSSEEYRDSRKHSSLLWEVATTNDLFPFSFNQASEYVLSSCSGLIILALILLPKEINNDYIQNRKTKVINDPTVLNDATVIESPSIWENIDKYLTKLKNTIKDNNKAKKSLDCEKVYGRLSGRAYAGPLFKLWYCTKDGVTDDKADKSLEDGQNKEWYRIDAATTVWQKKALEDIKNYDHQKEIYKETVSIVKAIRQTFRNYRSEYDSHLNEEERFRQSNIQIELEAKIAKAISNVVKDCMVIKDGSRGEFANDYQNEKKQCHEIIDIISGRIAWMLRIRCLSLTSDLRKEQIKSDH
jgi:hypothetical protein